MSSPRREPLWTRSGVRLQQVFSGPGRWNWLFVPGGPGVGSESLQGLVDVLAVPGSGWLVDLPGDGSNITPAGGGPNHIPAADPYAQWPGVLLEAAQALTDVVLVGHSTGGMFALSVPELEKHLAGVALVSSAPHAGWRAAFIDYAQRNPLPAVDQAGEDYARQPDESNLRALTLAAAPWNFTVAGVEAGRKVLAGLAYNPAAVTWAEEHFDDVYRAQWTPRDIPALIVGGAEDSIVTQGLWDEAPGFNRSNVLRRTIAGASHFPWVENPSEVTAAFADFVEALAMSRDESSLT